jgi:hypothetical protein
MIHGVEAVYDLLFITLVALTASFIGMALNQSRITVAHGLVSTHKRTTWDGQGPEY